MSYKESVICIALFITEKIMFLLYLLKYALGDCFNPYKSFSQST